MKSIVHFMREHLNKFHALAETLGYSPATFITRLQDYENNHESFKEKDPYLNSILDYLFEENSLSRPIDSKDSRAQFLIRYVVVYCYLAKLPRTVDAIEDALDSSFIDDLRVSSSELVDAIASIEKPALGRVAAWQYKEKALSVLRDNPEICLLDFGEDGGRECARYIAFTTKKLHKMIRPGNYSRRIWQGISDPVYFTLCLDPKGRLEHKGLCCELWIYDNAKGLDRWRRSFDEIGQEISLSEKSKINYMCVHRYLFPPDNLTPFGQDLVNYINNTLIELESSICQAYSLYSKEACK